jgi:hypothetical protein
MAASVYQGVHNVPAIGDEPEAGLIHSFQCVPGKMNQMLVSGRYDVGLRWAHNYYGINSCCFDYSHMVPDCTRPSTV